ncbi:hypothetical protein DPMN_155511 [Dreissena polymorpha]|uniref:Uncharacterized protein n=1 Tax=Dreissena polymorpha TaxID=45954 RepID=A0A9D4FMD0_DREPO|nr:hypothetical protein DPMN_155511 [Dreissena polymorpha]
MKRAIHVPLGGSNKSEAVGGFDVVGFIISFLLDPCAVFVALVCVVVIIYKRKWRIMTNGATPLIPCPDQPLPPMALGGF